MLERDKSTAPAADGSTLPGVKEEGTDLQGKVRYLGFVLKKDTRFQTLVGSYIPMALA